MHTQRHTVHTRSSSSTAGTADRIQYAVQSSTSNNAVAVYTHAWVQYVTHAKSSDVSWAESGNSGGVLGLRLYL